jgi:outer membrane murein-binding lipoprotein Lpp
MLNHLTQAILLLEQTLRADCKSSACQITKSDLQEIANKIMSAISDFATKQNAFNDRVDTAIAGLTTDVQTLTDKINALQNTPGQITPEDQALLDTIQSRTATIATKLEALDALTPPAPPVA